MGARILDGRALAKELRAELSNDIQAFRETYDVIPHLTVVQVRGDESSDRYARTIEKLCAQVGVAFSMVTLPETTSQTNLEHTIRGLNVDTAVHGVLIELPLPAHLAAQQAVLHLDHHKDVDGIHPMNVGLLAQGQPTLVPNTPAGGIEMLKRYEIEMAQKRAAVIGYSDVVGRPMAEMLLYARATVTICHKYTADLGAVLRECDIVLVAAGHAGLVTGAMLRPGAVVVDFGINVQPDGRIVGDVDFPSAVEVASAITPVPGGTGPVTNIMLLRNVLTAAQRQHNQQRQSHG